VAELTPINVYICANVLLVLASALLDGLRAVSSRLQPPMAYRHQLRLGQAMALAALPLPLLGSFSGRSSLLPQTAQVWSAPALRDAASVPLTEPQALVSLGSSSAFLPLDVASRVLTVLFAAGLLVVLARLARDAAATARIIGGAQTIRQYRSARILASEQTCVPFSFWLPGRHFVVVPAALVLSRDDLQLAIRHEAQHHRQHDTKLLYLHQLLEAAFFWNPAVHRLARQLRELQEFACDEALGRQRSVSTTDYCQCLLRVAEAATQRRRAPLHASLVGSAGKLLKRRIEALLAQPAAYSSRSVVLSLGAALLTLLATTALAFTSTIHDRRVSAREAAQMAALAQRDSAFPIVVNDSVVRELNRLISTPDGRASLQAGLARMKEYEGRITAQLVRHGMPLELLAVPLVESGYRNQPQGDDPRHGAGLWMFIAPMARNFDLRVDADRDDRLDVAAETDAAIRLFSALHRQFDDWGLALLGYNAGSQDVERAMIETGSCDVWSLIEQGHENDRGYVPRVMAAILILKNPSLLD